MPFMAAWMPGTQELVIILVIVLILFGPKNLPKVGAAIGRGIREFKNGVSGLTDAGDDNKPAEKEQDDANTVQPMKRKTEVLTTDGESAPTGSSAKSAEKQG